MLFLDLPFTERVRRIAELGFEVQLWDWTTKDLDALAATGATFSSMTGYVRGTLADPDGAEELLRTAAESLRVAERLDCPRLNVHGTGLDDQALPVVAAEVVTPAMWLQAARTLTRLAELGSGRGGSSPWRTSTPPSTTPAPRSPRRPTPSPWSRPSPAPICG
jgi:hydroxypyruvate isomerase